MTNATKHTPGPWTCNIDAEGLNVFQDDPEHPGNGDHIMCIPRHPESEANARLIAAAPEMLAALVEHALLDHSLPLDARWALYYDVDLALESACRQLEADQKAQEQLEIEETRAHEKHLEALRRE